MGSKRTRQWSFICYPESAPENWKEIIKATHIKTAISPLHDKDLNPTGDEKKPHWHVMFEFESLKSYDQVREITLMLNSSRPQQVHSPIGMIRYFIHKDNPEKHQYNWEDIIVYNGFDLDKYDSYTESEIDYIIADITQFIDDNTITEYADLISITRDKENNHFDDWYRIIRKNTLFFNSYISSRRNQYKEWKKNTLTQKKEQRKDQKSLKK